MVFLRTKTKLIIAVTAAVVVLVVFLWNPIISNSYESRGRLLSEKSFIIRTNGSGALESFLINNMSGIVDNYSIFNFDRGDVIDFQLFSRSKSVEEGDTLVQFSSSRYEEEIAKLNMTLAELQGLLSVYSTGEKKELIEELKLRVEHAQEQIKTEEKIFERSKLLLEKDIISQQDFEIVEGQLELYKIELSLAEQMLKTAETGEKPQEIRAAENQVKEAKNIILLLTQRSSRLKIISPIKGQVNSYANNDTLLVINSSFDKILQLPVPANRVRNLSPGDSIYIYYNDSVITLGIAVVDDNVFFYNGKPFVKITSNVFNTRETIPLNAVVMCEVELGKVTLMDYLTEVIN